MNRLQRAMNAADETEVEAAAIEAVTDALNAPTDGAQQSPVFQQAQQAMGPGSQQTLAQSQREVEAAAQRVRDLDAALADAIEVVARHRSRLGRRVCSRHDGEAVRRVFETLRGLLTEGGADADPSFQ
jgi:hypothetical protein